MLDSDSLTPHLNRINHPEGANRSRSGARGARLADVARSPYEGVVSGLAVVWAVIGLGWLLGRTALMPVSAQDALNRLVYLVGLPALVFLTLLNAHVGDLLGAPLIVAAVSGLAAAGIFAVIGRWGLCLSGERH